MAPRKNGARRMPISGEGKEEFDNLTPEDEKFIAEKGRKVWYTNPARVKAREKKLAQVEKDRITKKFPPMEYLERTDFVYDPTYTYKEPTRTIVPLVHDDYRKYAKLYVYKMPERYYSYPLEKQRAIDYYMSVYVKEHAAPAVPANFPSMKSVNNYTMLLDVKNDEALKWAELQAYSGSTVGSMRVGEESYELPATAGQLRKDATITQFFVATKNIPVHERRYMTGAGVRRLVHTGNPLRMNHRFSSINSADAVETKFYR